MKNQFKILIMILACLVLIISVLGCLNSSTYNYKFEGKIMTEDGSQPFNNANIYLELINITDPAHPTTVTSTVFENGEKENYNYVLEYNEKLDPKGIYIISAFVDMDDDEEISAGDYVSTNPLSQRIEPNILEQKYDIYVYPRE
ncbi:MAG: hypothetical protein FWH46_03195 [Methanimicrococcus sp.]|nr:hypothetical protein [Methanimicrococcus sp.]